MNRELNKLIELKQYVDYLVEEILIEEVNKNIPMAKMGGGIKRAIPNSDDEMYKRMSEEPRKFINNTSAKEARRIANLAHSDAKYSNQAIEDITRKGVMPWNVNKYKNQVNTNNVVVDASKKAVALANQKTEDQVGKIVIGTGIAGLGATAAGLGAAGYTAYKMAKRYKWKKRGCDKLSGKEKTKCQEYIKNKG